MPYSPPVGNVVNFDFSGIYSPPGGDVILFNFGAGDNSIIAGATIKLEFYGFDPLVTNPSPFNNITATASTFLEFFGFMPAVENLPGAQIEAFSVYVAGHAEEIGLQIEQGSVYIIGGGGGGNGTLQVEQFGVYIAGAPVTDMDIEAFSLYVAGNVTSNVLMDVEAASLYIPGSDTHADFQIEQYGVYLVGRIVPLVIPALAGVTPETPFTETWAWWSDIITAEDGTEQRINLRNEPRRNFSVRYTFDGEDEVRFAKQQLYAAFREEVAIPLYQYASRLKAKVLAGSTNLLFNPQRTDLRDGGWVLIVEGNKFDIKVIDAVNVDGCTVTTGLANSYTTRANAMAVAISLVDDKAVMAQYNSNLSSSVVLKGRETNPVVPFQRPGAITAPAMFNSIPVLERRATGESFEDIYNQGQIIIDFGGRVHFRYPWNFAQLGGPREYLCQRVLDLNDWDYWKAFFDYCKGSINPFYVPTYRDDFNIVTPPAASGATMTVAGHTYSDDYFGNGAFEQIAIYAEAGTHYAVVTAATPTGADDVLTFNPPLPAGIGWETDQMICLLLRARLGSDEVNLDHYALHSIIRTSIRTVDV